jgi:regulator of RNase E activity RraA
MLIADIDGAVVIPGGIAEEIVRKVEEVMSTESRVRTAVREGIDPKEAYLRHGRF